MKRKSLVLAITSVVLVLCISIGSAWAYFTDSSFAAGGITVNVEPTTTVTEENGPGTKDITIRNTSNVPVWVRARVYASSQLGANASGNAWSGEISSWYTYDEVLDAGEDTNTLHVTFDLKGGRSDETPDGALDGDEHNVVIVYESRPVQYDDNGDPVAATWNN